MAKPNTYILLREARRQIVELQGTVEYMKGFTLQQALDMAVITLYCEFDFVPEQVRKFKESFHKTFLEYANLCVEDNKDDKEIVYTKAKVDEALEEACGEPQDFDTRYDPRNLYFRERDLKRKEESSDA